MMIPLDHQNELMSILIRMTRSTTRGNIRHHPPGPWRTVMRNKSFSSGTPKGGRTKKTRSLISSTTVLPFSQSG